jgi:acetyl-CoA acetyltransferase
MNVYILGAVAHEAHQSINDRRLEEIAYETSHAALASCGVSRDEVDHVTLGASDELDGRGITSMLLAAPAGAYLRDEMRVTDSGMMALCMGALRVATGRFDCGLVVSWSQTSIASLEEVTRMRAEPFNLRPIGMNRAISDGLFAQAAASRFGIDAAAVDARVAERCQTAYRNERRASSQGTRTDANLPDDTIAYPLAGRHRAPVTDGAAALVLASEAWCRRNPQHRPLARLSAAAWAVDTYRLDARRLAGMEVFRNCFDLAMKRADLTSIDELDAIEFDAQDGWCDLAYQHELQSASRVRLSPSGGAWSQNPYFCTGLVNAVEAALQVSGRAGAVQVPGAKRVAAHGTHGFAQQAHAVVIMEGVAA